MPFIKQKGKLFTQRFVEAQQSIFTLWILFHKNLQRMQNSSNFKFQKLFTWIFQIAIQISKFQIEYSPLLHLNNWKYILMNENYRLSILTKPQKLSPKRCFRLKILLAF